MPDSISPAGDRDASDAAVFSRKSVSAKLNSTKRVVLSLPGRDGAVWLVAVLDGGSDEFDASATRDSAWTLARVAPAAAEV